MRKLRALVITSDRDMGLALCEVMKLGEQHALWVKTTEEWQIAREVYMPDFILYHVPGYYPDTEILNTFCGQIPVLLISVTSPSASLMRPYECYELNFLKAPCAMDEIMDAFHSATAALQNELSWLNRR